MQVQIDLGPWEVKAYHGCENLPDNAPNWSFYVVYVDLFRWVIRSDGLRWGERVNFATERVKTWAEARALVDQITPRAQAKAAEMNMEEGR